MADHDRADRHLGTDPGWRPGEGDRRDPLAGGAAVMHPGHDLLADIAALGEIDSMQPIEIGVMRKGIVEGEVESAGRYAEGDAVRLVGPVRFGSGLGPGLAIDDRAVTEVGVSRVAVGRVERRRRIGPGCQDAAGVAEVRHGDFGAEAIAGEHRRQGRCALGRAIEQKAGGLRVRAVDHEEIHRHLALGRQQGRVAGLTGLERLDIVGDEALEKGPRLLAFERDDTAVLEKRFAHPILA